MKIIKRIFLVLLAIVVIALVAALFVKKEMTAQREIVINKPKQQVFDYIKYVKNQDNYSKWNKLDPDMKKTYEGTDGTPGFVYSWESEKSDVGQGSQTITKVTEGERLDCDLHFIKPFDSKAIISMTTTAVNDSTTKVTWGFDGKMNYPLNLMRVFMDMEKSIGDDFSTGLNNLKAVLEK